MLLYLLVESDNMPMLGYLNGYLVKEEDLFQDLEQVNLHPLYQERIWRGGV